MRRRGFWAAQAEHVLLRVRFRVAVARAEGQAFQNICPWDSAFWLRTLVPHHESTPRALQILQQLRPLDVQRHPPLHRSHHTWQIGLALRCARHPVTRLLPPQPSLAMGWTCRSYAAGTHPSASLDVLGRPPPSRPRGKPPLSYGHSLANDLHIAGIVTERTALGNGTASSWMELAQESVQSDGVLWPPASNVETGNASIPQQRGGRTRLRSRTRILRQTCESQSHRVAVAATKSQNRRRLQRRHLFWPPQRGLADCGPVQAG